MYAAVMIADRPVLRVDKNVVNNPGDQSILGRPDCPGEASKEPAAKMGEDPQYTTRPMGRDPHGFFQGSGM